MADRAEGDSAQAGSGWGWGWGRLAAGPLLALLVWSLPASAPLAGPAQRVGGLAAWMAVWWLTAAIPLTATSLLPLVLLPILGVSSIDEVAARYADPLIFLFMGGFFLARATERWGLHRRFALWVIAVVGAGPARLVLAFMLATGFASMWLSNTATTVMMLPIATAVLAATGHQGEDARAFGAALMLGVAYSASIGGVATLIGTPPNAIFAASAAALVGQPIGFAQWMAVGVPTSVVLMALAWLMLTRVEYRLPATLGGVGDHLTAEREALGPWTPGEVVTAVVFGSAALAWVLRAPKTFGEVTIPGLATLLPGLTDTGIAIGAALILFAVPASLTQRRFVLDWPTAEKIPWGVLLLFGGGLALAAAFEVSGLAAWIGGRLEVLRGAPPLLLVGAVVALFVFLTEITSNSATATMGMPIMASLAVAVGADPVRIMAAAAMAASCAFMLPVATPPNAIVFGSGAVTAGQMARAGIWLNLIGIVVITAIMMIWRVG